MLLSVILSYFMTSSQHTGPYQWFEARLACEPISPDAPQGFKFQNFGVGGINVFYGLAGRPRPGVGGPASGPSARNWGSEGEGPTLSRVAVPHRHFPPVGTPLPQPQAHPEASQAVAVCGESGAGNLCVQR